MYNFRNSLFPYFFLNCCLQILHHQLNFYVLCNCNMYCIKFLASVPDPVSYSCACLRMDYFTAWSSLQRSPTPPSWAGGVHPSLTLPGYVATPMIGRTNSCLGTRPYMRIWSGPQTTPTPGRVRWACASNRL